LRKKTKFHNFSLLLKYEKPIYRWAFFIAVESVLDAGWRSLPQLAERPVSENEPDVCHPDFDIVTPAQFLAVILKLNRIY
jgi:hypothetical protein